MPGSALARIFIRSTTLAASVESMPIAIPFKLFAKVQIDEDGDIFMEKGAEHISERHTPGI
jgi:hypothetical protein